jgi:hypothetical protein
MCVAQPEEFFSVESLQSSPGQIGKLESQTKVQSLGDQSMVGFRHSSEIRDKTIAQNARVSKT